ncbi:PREDICTED: LEAF RUST 10 DISEASE-RESISTANCE LOCUS RECEPTOR-LIKE PROTEIN KINASE-like 2.2 [Prunus mume]|uniref:LEAF RUST 10 DISEASE-RESISTANCE LOCUS RECEPTOR-LIKE PROTEIN KINASE-like 2.2 n=1 Tax=Prunus mume TaxID=102107 RepID=A0ABM0PWR5_PRUMU|nr:PREDICTED: LEAF RUST 10 DISEASE-RESISTANCE LOCUS RECEPTOR-LIKE PROTEIN KINASE-like 2.2 [Prunus mume]
MVIQYQIENLSLIMSRLSFLSAAFLIHPLLLLLLPSSCSQTTSLTANKDNISDCTRSCGNINISYPFRLKGDSKDCGIERYELSCEANGNGLTHHAVLYLFSGKYYVHEIDYNNLTIRLVDAGVFKISDNYFSHPHYSLTRFNFSYKFFPYILHNELNPSSLPVPIIFLSCENPMNSSAIIVETAPCINGISSYSSSNSSLSSLRTYSYFMVGRSGHNTAESLGKTCQITLMVTVFPSTEDNMTSCKGIYNEIAHGFELSWSLECDKNGTTIKCSSTRVLPWYDEIIMKIIDKIGPGLEKIYALFHFERRFPMHASGLYLGQLLGCAVASLAIYLAAKFTFGFPLVTALLIYKWRRRHLSMYENIEDFLRSNNNLMPIRYSYSDIKKMARGFKDKLGEGGYGSVYKAKLRSGRLVAIKMLGKSKTKGQDFINEVGTIGRIRHVNVVRLIGFCVDGSKRALVYDFMSNGSLEKYIFSQQGDVSLSCQKTFEIALGVARGIDYLHRGCDMQILHFDIKPHNILLDENFTPKVSDFGLAKLYPLDNSIVSLTAARGTMGYIAPELFYKNIGGVSYKADVYSFGMLLMEMAGRRKNLNAGIEQSSQFSQIYFPTWVSDQLKAGKNIEIGDDATDEEKKIIKKMMMVALWCIQMKPIERPSMNKVVEMLEGEIESLQMPPRPFLYPQQIPADEVGGDNRSPCASSASESEEITLIADANVREI